MRRWITGDLLAGLNIGAIGSTTSFSGVMAGAMNSSEWFGKIPNTSLFSHLQHHEAYYNSICRNITKVLPGMQFCLF